MSLIERLLPYLQLYEPADAAELEAKRLLEGAVAGELSNRVFPGEGSGPAAVPFRTEERIKPEVVAVVRELLFRQPLQP